MADLLRFEHLSKSYGRRPVLRDVGGALEPGKVWGLLGRNGEGKTTLIRTVLGIIPADAGVVVHGGRPVAFGSASFRRRIGYVPEDPFFYGWMTVGGLLAFNRRFYPKREPRRDAADLERLALDPAAKVRSLSRGERLRLAFAVALAAEPELLVLDDPTSGLDVPTRRDFLREVIRELADGGTAVLFATHLVHELERIVDRVAILHGGRFAVDEPYDALRGRARRVVLGFDQAPPPGPFPGPVVAETRSGRDVELFVYPWSEESETAFRALGPARLESAPLGLEDIFSGFVDGRGARPVGGDHV